jgi:hypothetical protein
MNETELKNRTNVDALRQETCELTAIMAASRISASGRR